MRVVERGEEKKGARGSSQAALMLKLISVHTLAHKHRTQHTHARTNGVSGQTSFADTMMLVREREKENGRGREREGERGGTGD